jgi:CheY-like chemotaxis protein
VSDNRDPSLPARVAHGINNPLTAVIANLETALRELEGMVDKGNGHNAVAERLLDAREAAYRIHSVVRELTKSADPQTVSDARIAHGVEAATTSTASSRRGRVLVVDDELLITNAVRRLLASSHDVTATSSAADALARVWSGERFDVIVCDLTMPTMSGMDLHAQLLALAPDQAAKMVFLTGGAFTANARAFLDHVPNERIQKPFDPRSLKSLVDSRVR